MYITVPVVKTPEDYQAALTRLEEIFHAQPGTPESDEADVLVMMINAYEDKNYPIEPADPIAVIKYVMEQKGLEQADLAGYVGGKNQVSEVLGGKRALVLDMIRNLSRGLHIPVEALIRT